jgi:hypothetical protein
MSAIPVLCGHSQVQSLDSHQKKPKPAPAPEEEILTVGIRIPDDQRLRAEEKPQKFAHILATNLNMGGSNFNRAAKSGTFTVICILSGLVYCYECGRNALLSSGQGNCHGHCLHWLGHQLV